MEKLKSINPSNYEVLGEVEISTLQEVEEKVRLAREAQKEWRSLGVAGRVAVLRKDFEEFKSKKEEISLLSSQEMGVPITDALEGFEAAFGYANWYFDNAEKYLSPETTFEDDKEIHQVFYEPIGVAAVIIPWNFPFDNFIWGCVQSLLAGNTIVLKHSEECPLSGKLIEEVMCRHLPKGVFNEVYGDGEVGKLLVEQDIDMIAFTGSTKTGKYLYEVAGRKFIKAVMELGGSAPGIIFEDANIEEAVGSVCSNRLYNQGQCCDGLKRLLVHESIYDSVLEKAAAHLSAKKVGNAQEKDTEVGPLVAKRQLETLILQVEDAKAKGAKVIVGGNSLEEKMGGAFFEPTLLTDITNDMKVWVEEVFGPVLPIVKFATDEEAIELANQTNYGLGAYVYTQNKERVDRVSAALESGMVSVNGVNYVMPFNPFGGYKNSGFGREHGKYGFHEVTQIKVISMEK